MFGLIAERRKSGVRHDDLLDLLLHARDEQTGAALSDAELRDETLTIFSAGHETTANALAWTWYLLATHREARARFHEELDRVLGGRAPTGDDLPHLPYARAVFEESLRLYPPAPAVQRKAASATTVCGVPLADEAVVLVNIHNLHRHPDFWDEPERFKPERFVGEGAGPTHRTAYMPFGAGPRACIGTYFASVEGPLLLAVIGRRFDLRLLPGHRVEPELIVTLRPKGGLPMEIVARKP
jgi:cytochrome P450